MEPSPLAVHHRVDGLEKICISLGCFSTVHHRVDGLENYIIQMFMGGVVHHRVDGLETPNRLFIN